MIALAELGVAAFVVEYRAGEDGYVFVEINPAAAALRMGHKGEGASAIRLKDAFSPEVAARVAESYDLCRATRQPIERESTISTPDGTLTARTSLYPMTNGTDGHHRFLGIVTDVTEERRLRDKLEQSKIRLAVAMDALGGAHWFYDAARQTFELGPTFFHLLGSRYMPSMTLSEWLSLVHPDDREDTCFNDLLAGHVHSAFREFRIIGAGNAERWLRCHRRAVLKDAHVTGVAGVVIDITAEKTRELALNHQATTDPLTGLANRRRFEAAFRDQLASSGSTALFMIDVDQFKAYNDHHGHVAGDAVLKKIAAAIESVALQSGGMAARYGGEEFIAVVRADDMLALNRTAAALIEAVDALREPHGAIGQGFVTISVGCVRQGASHDPLDLIRLADTALYQAKREGRHCFRRAVIPGKPRAVA